VSSTLWPWFDIATSAAHAGGCSRLIPASQWTPTACEALHDGALRSTREVPCKGARAQQSTSPSMARRSSSAPVCICRSGSVALFHRPCSLAPRFMPPQASCQQPTVRTLERGNSVAVGFGISGCRRRSGLGERHDGTCENLHNVIWDPTCQW
jgi:hypothetical protein